MRASDNISIAYHWGHALEGWPWFSLPLSLTIARTHTLFLWNSPRLSACPSVFLSLSFSLASLELSPFQERQKPVFLPALALAAQREKIDVQNIPEG